MEESQPRPTTLLSIRLLDGELVKAKFPAHATLEKVAQYVCQKAKDLKKERLPKGKAYTVPCGIEFESIQPRRLFEVETFSLVTLDQAGLCPSATLHTVVVDAERAVKRGVGTIEDAKKGDAYIPSYRVKGDSHDQKERFKKEQTEKEIEAKKQEHEKKKRELEKIRNQIEGDKEARKDKVWVTPEKKAPASTPYTLNDDQKVDRLIDEDH